LRITVIRYRGVPPPRPIAFDFDQRGGKLGREPGNELALPDPERHVSRVQARIDFDGRNFGLIDQGTNPSRVDGRALSKGERLVLAGGEIITMGEYELLVERPASVSCASVPPAEPRPAEAVSEDPFSVFAAAGRGPEAEPQAPADPFPRLAPAPGPGAGDVLGLGHDTGSASIDALFGLGSGQADSLAGTPLDASLPTAGHETDPLALFGAERVPATGPLAEPQRDDAPLLQQPFSAQQALKPLSEPVVDLPPPTVVQARTEPEPQQGMVLSWKERKRGLAQHQEGHGTPAPSASAQDADLQAAFLRGLGIPIDLPQGLTPQLMEQIGSMLREATQGTLDLLKARAVTKREVRAEATMIASRDNNPLKFSPDLAFALAQMLTARSQGFMGAREAMRDAYDDLRAHQLGLMAGMRSALAGVLERFEPSVLEARVAAHSLLDRLQPSGRKSRLWDLYQQHYAGLAREASDDFNALFGKAFLEAYEQQVGQLQASDREARADSTGSS
jgi:FHA domain-containing protein